MKDVLNVKPVLLKQNAPEMDAFQQRLLNSQRETYLLLKPDAPKTNAFHVKDVVNIEPFLFDTMPPKCAKWMPFVTTVLNAKPFLVSHDGPHMDAFSVKEIVNIELFLFDILPLKQMMADVLNVNPLFCSSKFWKRRSEL